MGGMMDTNVLLIPLFTNSRLYYPYISSAPIFLYFDLHLNTAYAEHYVYFIENFGGFITFIELFS